MVGNPFYLHTKASKYFTIHPSLPKGYKDPELQSLKGQIDRLKSREDDFCRRFGFNNFEEMIKKIRELFNNSQNDLHALQRFSTSNLRTYFEKFKKLNTELLIDQPIKIHFEIDNKKINFGKEFSEAVGSGRTIFDGGIIQLKYTINTKETQDIFLTWNTSRVKNIVDKVKGKHFQRDSENITRLIDFLQEDDTIKITMGKSGQTVQDFLLENRTSLFQYTKKEIEEMKKNNPALYSKLTSQIHSFVFKELCAGASANFKRAVLQVWGQRNMIDFFMGGNKWITNAVGSFGEFQAAILFQYLANNSNPIAARQITNIIGDKLNKYSEQMRSDIRLFEAFGIQVKNYSGATSKDYGTGKETEREVTVNLHPSQLASLGAGDVTGYIANSYFNSSVTPFSDSEINDFIRSHTAELLNLDLGLDLSSDRVSLYLIGGHLIPGSEIMYSACNKKNRAIKTRTVITHPSPEGDDDYFNSSEVNGEGKRTAPPFTKYWKSNSVPAREGDFTPTEKASFGNIDSKVTFHTTFTYSAFFNATAKHVNGSFSSYRLF